MKAVLFAFLAVGLTGALAAPASPEKERCLLATTCLEGSHPFWNPVTKQCTCNSNDAEFICKAATTCSPGSVPKWHPRTETCVCEKVRTRQVVDPTTCPLIRCMSGTKATWVPYLNKCICEKIPVPDPKTCPLMKCPAGYKPLYNPKTKSCSCQPDPTQCVGWVCIAEKRPVYDPKTGKCGCEWIPGLEPGTPTAAPRSAEEESAPVEERVAEPALVYPACRDIYCIAEQRPVYDPASKTCKCEWIPGLGPVSVKAREPATPVPTPYDPLNCYLLKIYCEGGDHHMHYDPKSQTCKCPPVKIGYPEPTVA